MATTAKGTPYVESSDLVADYPSVSLALAEHIDDVSGILQVVRATDSTYRSTNSTSLVDVGGMTVSITPQISTSSILILSSFRAQTIGSGELNQSFAITDSSNNALSGANNHSMTLVTSQLVIPVFIVGFVASVNTTARSYKLRHLIVDSADTAIIRNDINPGQMYAIEVSA